MSDKFAIYPSLKGKTVIVTGGSQGIGMEMVKAFAAQGSKVGIIDIDLEGAETLAADLSASTGAQISVAHCDLRDIDALKIAFAKIKADLGPAWVLVNNAARDDRHGYETVTSEYFDERMATNVKHQLFSIQAVAQDMIDQGGGSIINMGSNSWWEKGGGFPVYTMAKAAVHGLTRGMARDLGPHRIRVNAVVPGWIMTDRQKELWVTPESIGAHQQNQCLPDLIDPVYVARMVLFLASDDAAMCTASNYMIDAGSI